MIKYRLANGKEFEIDTNINYGSIDGKTGKYRYSNVIEMFNHVCRLPIRPIFFMMKGLRGKLEKDIEKIVITDNKKELEECNNFLELTKRVMEATEIKE